MMNDLVNEQINVAGLPLQFPKPSAGSQLPTLAEWNQRYIEYVLNFTKGKKTAAARILGINRRTLYRRKKTKTPQSPLAASAAGFMDSSVTEVPPGHQVQ
jgi:DNA-binding NtrC family response regulator